MKKLISFLLIGGILSLGAVSCMADTLSRATDVFEVTEDGQKMQIVSVLDEGTEYELIERLITPEGSAFDSYYYVSTPIEWMKISYRDWNGNMQQGWIVPNPDAISGIKMSVFNGNSSEEYEEYNGYDGGFVLCESLSLRENPEVTSNILTTLKYGARCTIIGENGSWYNIVYSRDQSPSYSGWAKKDYILVNPDYFTPNGETPVYALPSNNSKRVGLISGETDYPIIGELNGFLAISLRGASGFVARP